MAEYLTNTTDLTKVADAIRTKGGTTDPLIYPDGFVTAIQSIEAGGGDVLINGKRCLFGTATSSNGQSYLHVLTYDETLDILGGSLFSNYVCAWWSSALEDTGSSGAVYAIGGKNTNGTPHYMNGKTVTRGRMTNIGAMNTNGIWLQTYSSSSFLAGQEYNWIFIEV